MGMSDLVWLVDELVIEPRAPKELCFETKNYGDIFPSLTLYTPYPAIYQLVCKSAEKALGGYGENPTTCRVEKFQNRDILGALQWHDRQIYFPVHLIITLQCRQYTYLGCVGLKCLSVHIDFFDIEMFFVGKTA